MITIYTSEEIEKIAAAGKLTADTLSMLEKEVRPGISTLELDEMAEKFIRSRGGIPSCKGYEDFQEVSAPLSTIQLSMGSLLPERF